MQSHAKVVKRAMAVLAFGLLTLVGGSAGAADGEGFTGGKADLFKRTQDALQEQDVLQNVAYEAYAYDGKIGDAAKGEYQIKPEQIIPWRVADNSSISVVKVMAISGKQQRLYTYAFVFSAKGLRTLLLYPGTSNADPALFSDVFPPALGYAQGMLESENVNIKDTRVVGEIAQSGWDEEWLWVNDTGKTYAMKIAFSTGAAGGGTMWNIKGQRK